MENLSDWQLTLYDDVREITLSWPEPRRLDNFWLRAPTLAFLNSHPQGMTTEAVILTHTPSGRRILLSVQSFYFRLGAQVSETAKGLTSRWNFRRRILAPLTSKVLVIGQLLTSGDLAQEGTEWLSGRELAHLLSATTDTLLAERPGYRAVLVKDVCRADSVGERELSRRGFTTLPVDPVMVLDLQEWNSVEEYQLSLTSKYRVRYRRARSKLGKLTRRRIQHSEAEDRLEAMYALYRETTSGAAFNLTALTPAYLSWLVRVGEVHGYFTPDGQLVGFTSAIANGPLYQAHYLGLRESYKYSHHLYHNMLFDLLEDALSGGYRELDYGRTAPEIKSSIGAEPRRFATQLRLCSPVVNALVPRFVPAVFEAKGWVQRNPFRRGE
ncbi:hypothetical protein GGR28_001323 [Lewinella aquimaris]|uniref:BioF2-like acetyltransferase domain-containing protein n=1 Tax=Neolewinella aquimaris TaxID=1835722 RepID=A0A840E0P8_9BACT|nr:GNAT family N-acetyltransferase [Neolewinella aquimaris]MBB4078710.1 hypothetical protein [Neolewinella aquimaris]